MIENETWLTREEAAHYLGVKLGTLRVWASTKKHLIPYRYISRRSYYRKIDLDKYIESRTRGV